MTRAMIREKYGIVRLEPPENAVKRTIENFEALWNEDYSGDID